MDKPLFECVDCISLYVDNLDDGIEFYQNRLGLKLLWREKSSCGLGMASGVTEVVLVCEHNPTANFKVASVEQALTTFIKAGGTVVYGPFDINVGKCAVVADLWNNQYCLMDLSKGTYTTDENGNVTGLKK